MKKTYKPYIILSIVSIAVVTILMLLYVAVKLECERSVKEKNILEHDLVSAQDRHKDLITTVKILEAEERITIIAESELNMVKSVDKYYKIKVNGEKIREIEAKVNSKYE